MFITFFPKKNFAHGIILTQTGLIEIYPITHWQKAKDMIQNQRIVENHIIRHGDASTVDSGLIQNWVNLG